MGVITSCVGQLSDIGAIGPDREYAKVGTVLTDEYNQIATWRPYGEIIPSLRQIGHGVIIEINDTQTIWRRIDASQASPPRSSL